MKGMSMGKVQTPEVPRYTSSHPLGFYSSTARTSQDLHGNTVAVS